MVRVPALKKGAKSCELCKRFFLPTTCQNKYCVECVKEATRRSGLKAAKKFAANHPEYVAHTDKIASIRKHLSRAIYASEIAFSKVDAYAQLLAIELAKASNRRKFPRNGGQAGVKEFTPFLDQKISENEVEKNGL